MVKSISIALLTGTLALVGSAFGQASDNAGNYGGVWSNGSNGGTGFTVWDLSGNNNDSTTNFAGYFLASSTAGSGDINTGGNSFGIYANPATAFANANRGFAQGDLLSGQTFSLQLAVNFRNGNKGLNLYSGTTQLFNFNVGGDNYSFTPAGGTGTNLSFAYQADSVFTLSFTRTIGTAFDVSIVRTSNAGGTETFSQSFDFGASINNFRLYNSGTDDGGAANNLYFNNLAISAVPEPTTLSLVAIGTAFGGWAFTRRRRG